MKHIDYLLSYAALFISLHATCQHSHKSLGFRQALGAELRNSQFFGRPLQVDLNCDGKKDFAAILQNKQKHEEVRLLVFYSRGDTLAKQDLGMLADTMDLSVSFCSKDNPCGQTGSLDCGGIFVSSNDRNYLFVYDPGAKRFEMKFENHLGP